MQRFRKGKSTTSPKFEKAEKDHKRKSLPKVKKIIERLRAWNKLAGPGGDKELQHLPSSRNVNLVQVRDAMLYHSFVASKNVVTSQEGAGEMPARYTSHRKRDSLLEAPIGSDPLDPILKLVLRWLIEILRPTEVCRFLTALRIASVSDNTRSLSFVSIGNTLDDITISNDTSKAPVRYYMAVISNRLSGVEQSAIFLLQSPTAMGEDLGIVRIIPIYSDLHIKLTGDGSFSLNSVGESVVIGAASIHSMWSAIASLQRARNIAKQERLFPLGHSHEWVSVYSVVHRVPGVHHSIGILSQNQSNYANVNKDLILGNRKDVEGTTDDIARSSVSSVKHAIHMFSGSSESSCGGTKSVTDSSTNFDSEVEPVTKDKTSNHKKSMKLKKPLRSGLPTKTELVSTLRKFVSAIPDPDNLTTQDVVDHLHVQFGKHLIGEDGYSKAFIDEQILRVYGQLEPPSKILDQLYLGTEYNASNKEELIRLGIEYVLNVTIEIENFFPDLLNYKQIAIKDVPESNILEHLDSGVKFIDDAIKEGSKVLVHCQRGVSRSASVVIAYVMLTKDISYEEARHFVRSRRACVHPNKGFVQQLHEYEATL